MIDMGDVRKEIEKLNSKFMESVKKQDIDGIISIYSENAFFMFPNMPMVQGHETLRMAFKGMFDAGIKEINLKIGEVIDAGDYAIERSIYTQKIQPPGMGVIEDVGKYVVVWKKTPDGYKVYLDIINSDLPPPPS
jgi:ketosteroid isomerase-like protein